VKATELTLEQGKALVRAIEALKTIEAVGPVEQAMVWLLVHAYRRQFRAVVGTPPSQLGKPILGAGEQVG